jgi:hypothetical protein
METQNSREVEYPAAEALQSKEETETKKLSALRRAFRPIRWLASGPGDWFGRKSVSAGAHMVGNLWSQTRKSPQRNSRFKVDDGGEFDLKATAFSYGTSVEALHTRLSQRRRLTMLVSYGALSIAVLSIIFWIHAAIDQAYTLARIITAIEFLPFIGLSVLLAFYNALLNFQIRSCRFAGWREFLSTEKGFFPR